SFLRSQNQAHAPWEWIVAEFGLRMTSMLRIQRSKPYSTTHRLRVTKVRPNRRKRERRNEIPARYGCLAVDSSRARSPFCEGERSNRRNRAGGLFVGRVCLGNRDQIQFRKIAVARTGSNVCAAANGRAGSASVGSFAPARFGGFPT